MKKYPIKPARKTELSFFSQGAKRGMNIPLKKSETMNTVRVINHLSLLKG